MLSEDEFLFKNEFEREKKDFNHLKLLEMVYFEYLCTFLFIIYVNYIFPWRAHKGHMSQNHY